MPVSFKQAADPLNRVHKVVYIPFAQGEGAKAIKDSVGRTVDCSRLKFPQLFRYNSPVWKGLMHLKSDLPGPAPETVAAPGIFLRGGGRYTKSMPPTPCSRATVLPAHEHQEKVNAAHALCL